MMEQAGHRTLIDIPFFYNLIFDIISCDSKNLDLILENCMKHMYHFHMYHTIFLLL